MANKEFNDTLENLRDSQENTEDLVRDLEIEQIGTTIETIEVGSNILGVSSALSDMKESVVDSIQQQTTEETKNTESQNQETKKSSEALGKLKENISQPFVTVKNSLLAPLQQIKGGIAALPGADILSGGFKDLKAGLAGSRRKTPEEKNEEATQAEKRDTLLESIGDGILGLKEGLLEGLKGLKDNGLMGLGILAGLVAAPFVAISAFFTQLGKEVAVLKGLLGRIPNIFKSITGFFGRIGKFFMNTKVGKFLFPVTEPLKNMFGRIGDIFKSGGKLVKTATTAVTSRTITPVVNFFTNISKQFSAGLKGLKVAQNSAGQFTKLNIFSKIGSFFKSVSNFLRPVVDGVKKIAGIAKSSTSFLAGFQPVIKFAATIGKTLGKLFLPVTIIMGVFDFVSGFMDGYSEDGIIGGLREGLVSVFDGLIAAPIKLLTGAVDWILGAIGLDQLGAGLTEGVTQVLDGLMGGFRGIFDVIQGIFTFDLDMIGEGLGAIFSGMTDVLLAPFQLVYGLIQDIFSIAGIELPDFNLSEWVTEWFDTIVNYFKEKLEMLNPLNWFSDDETELTPEQAERRERQERIAELEEDVADGKNFFQSDESFAKQQEELAQLKAEEQAAPQTTSQEETRRIKTAGGTVMVPISRVQNPDDERSWRAAAFEISQEKRKSAAQQMTTGQRTPTVSASELQSQPQSSPEIVPTTRGTEMKTERTGMLMQTSNENAMAARTGMQPQQPVVVSAPQTNVSNTSNNTTTTTSVVNGDLAFRKVSTYDF